MPRARLRVVWRDIYDSLWFLPALFTAAAIVLAFLLVRAEGVLPEAFREQRLAWLFAGGPEGARGVLAAIAGSLITVTGVVFSVTIVALQLASSQYTPRVLRTFMADRANQLVLAVFIGTFVYAIFVMRTIYAGDGGVGPFVPSLAVTTAVLLSVISIGFLIFYIHHVAVSLQVETIMANVTADTLRVIEQQYPREGEDEPPHQAIGTEHVVWSKGSGYITALDEDRLLHIARRSGCLVRVDIPVGEFVYPGTRLATICGDPPGDEALDKAAGAFATGASRTPHQDVGLGIVELVDIGVKALSPGINDPTTAMGAIDRLGELLLELGRRGRRTKRSEDGAVLLLKLPTYADVLHLGIDQIMHYAADSAAVLEHMVRMLGRIGALLPESRRPAITAQLVRIGRFSRERLKNDADRSTLERAIDRAVLMIGSA